VLVSSLRRGLVFEQRAGGWALAGEITRHVTGAFDLGAELDKGNYSVSTPKWNDLRIGVQVFEVSALDVP
jgi:hypothetical protein